MHAACRARITLQRVNLPVWGLYEIKCNLSREMISCYKGLYPIEDIRMIHMLKNNRRTLPRSECGWIRRVCGNLSVVTDTIRADFRPSNVTLRHPWGV